MTKMSSGVTRSSINPICSWIIWKSPAQAWLRCVLSHEVCAGSLCFRRERVTDVSRDESSRLAKRSFHHTASNLSPCRQVLQLHDITVLTNRTEIYKSCTSLTRWSASTHGYDYVPTRVWKKLIKCLYYIYTGLKLTPYKTGSHSYVEKRLQISKLVFK